MTCMSQDVVSFGSRPALGSSSSARSYCDEEELTFVGEVARRRVGHVSRRSWRGQAFAC